MTWALFLFNKHLTLKAQEALQQKPNGQQNARKCWEIIFDGSGKSRHYQVLKRKMHQYKLKPLANSPPA